MPANVNVKLNAIALLIRDTYMKTSIYLQNIYMVMIGQAQERVKTIGTTKCNEMCKRQLPDGLIAVICAACFLSK
ncbi:MAG: hypothetical protein CML22_08235 [Rheinheimera sp.]|nr:hypothetical protein [Rheinheimera sp.]MBM34276.1 hypothetical protein [Rheinheimera sp.]HAW92269.1 hypothetical protein [Candidatus Azambacteria bacterium]